jgi:hypothetical protein
MPTAIPVVTDPVELTPEWLTQALRVSGVLAPGVAVTSLAHRRVGSGQVGACYLLDPTYDDTTDAPSSLVAKVASQDEGSRAFAVRLDTYGREVAFYTDIADELAIRVPRCFGAALSPARDAFVLLLEDLGPATECEQIAGCTTAQAAVALDALAALHGTSWRSEELGELDWLRSGLGVWEGIAAGIGDIRLGLRARYGERLEPEFLEVMEHLAGGACEAWVRTMREPLCLWHCDFRLDNLMFDARGGQVPVVALDWQSVTLARGTADASYFVGAGLPVDDRRAHEEGLLRGYHDALLGHGARDYDWGECWEDYRRNAVSGFLVAAAASVSVEQTERGDEMFLTMLRRHGQQVLDHESLELLEDTA